MLTVIWLTCLGFFLFMKLYMTVIEPARKKSAVPGWEMKAGYQLPPAAQSLLPESARKTGEHMIQVFEGDDLQTLTRKANRADQRVKQYDAEQEQARNRALARYHGSDSLLAYHDLDMFRPYWSDPIRANLAAEASRCQIAYEDRKDAEKNIATYFSWLDWFRSLEKDDAMAELARLGQHDMVKVLK